MIGFGIDLSGYTAGKTTLAVVEIEGNKARATLLRGSALSVRRRTDEQLDGILAEEIGVLRRCLKIAPVAVDVPIDLQNLPTPTNPQRVWELTLRPIDRAVRAMPALADRIGAPVARFAAIIRAGDFDGLLGERLFEAYPAGTFRVLNIVAGNYDGPNGFEALQALCTQLNVNPSVHNDDDLDAIICAIAAAFPIEGICEARMLKVEGELPRGFRIPRSLQFDDIQFEEKGFEEWMTIRGAFDDA